MLANTIGQEILRCIGKSLIQWNLFSKPPNLMSWIHFSTSSIFYVVTLARAVIFMWCWVWSMLHKKKLNISFCSQRISVNLWIESQYRTISSFQIQHHSYYTNEITKSHCWYRKKKLKDIFSTNISSKELSQRVMELGNRSQRNYY